MEYEVIDIQDVNESCFQIEIEITETRQRRFYNYPKFEGWEDEINGVSMFIADIEKRLSQEVKKKNETFNLSQLKSNLVGTKKKVIEKQEPIKKKIDIKKTGAK
jgi:hypothetical protein